MENKFIYWHKVILIDREIFRKFKINQIVGFFRKEKEWGILNKECTSIEPYIKFRYLGRTSYTEDKQKNKLEFNKFMENIKNGK